MKQDWNPEAYAKFRGFRLRPAMDLLAQIGALPAGDVIDLGCGNGAVGAALAQRFSSHNLIGIDASTAMLGKAAETGVYETLTKADASEWQPDTPPALIFSNALCHWLPDHPALFPRLAAMLAKGGILAVQMPRQFAAPSHQALRDVAQTLFADRFDFTGWCAPVAPPQTYERMLAPLGEVSVWETDYIQRLDAVEVGHPVRHFTQSTALRPFADELNAVELDRFIAAYEDALSGHYPAEKDGSVLFPFKRLFFTLQA